MQPEIQIFDRHLLQIKRSRTAHSLANTDFLIKHSLEDILERLEDMNKKFPLILNLGSRTGYASTQLSNRSGSLRVIDTDISLELIKQNNNKNKIILDEENLPFANNTFDLVISILNLHQINDLPGCLIQLKNSLKPNGLLIASLFGEQNLFELRNILMQTELQCFNGISPRFSPAIDIKQLGGLLQRAGFDMPVIDKDVIKVNYSSPLKLLHDLRNMGESNIMNRRNKQYLGKNFWNQFKQNYIKTYGNSDGTVQASYEILTLTAIKKIDN